MNSKSTEMMKKTCKDHFFKAGQWFWFVFVYGIALIAFSSLIQKSFFADDFTANCCLWNISFFYERTNCL